MEEKLINNLSIYANGSQEKIESIEQIIYSLNKFIRDPEILNETYASDLSRAVSSILQHSNISGQRGDELASDLIFRVVKLFFNFSEKNYDNRNEVAKELYKIIIDIFDKYYKHNFFVTKESEKDLVKGTHKELNYKDYNKFFLTDFQITDNKKTFDQKDAVDIYVKKYDPNNTLYQKEEWVKGVISSVSYDNKEYTIKYFGQIGNSHHIDKENFPFNSPYVVVRGAKTEYLDSKINFKTNDKVDICIEKEKDKEKKYIWCPGKIINTEKKKCRG